MIDIKELPAYQELLETQKRTDAKLAEVGALIERNAVEADRRAKEYDERWEQSRKEYDERLEASRKERDKLFDQSRKEYDKRAAKTDEQLRSLEGEFTNRWGSFVETLVRGDLVPLLDARGIAVTSIAQQRTWQRAGAQREYDIIAVNGEEVVVVEVKSTLRTGDVTDFLGKLHEFTDWCKEYRGFRIFGAVAYLGADASVVTYAVRQGLFVIRATGNSASIVNAPEFVPLQFPA